MRSLLLEGPGRRHRDRSSFPAIVLGAIGGILLQRMMFGSSWTAFRRGYGRGWRLSTSTTGGEVAIVSVTSDVGTVRLALCALPPRVSLAAFLRRRQSPAGFGAVRGCQWPQLAVPGSCFTTCSARTRSPSGRERLCQDETPTVCQGSPRRTLRNTGAGKFGRSHLIILTRFTGPSREEIEALRDGWSGSVI